MRWKLMYDTMTILALELVLTGHIQIYKIASQLN